jgi:hypothetical protein
MKKTAQQSQSSLHVHAAQQCVDLMMDSLPVGIAIDHAMLEIARLAKHYIH